MIMNYKILLFDLDDTLLDFKANEIDSLGKLFGMHGHALTDELFQKYNSINKQSWTDYELGNVALDEVLNTRFAKTMEQFGEIVDGQEWEKQYREFLGNGHQLMDGAVELCKKLSKSYRLFVVTNGVSQTQTKRLKLSGLDEYFEDVFTSQEIGYQKPLREFFDYVVNHVEDFCIDEALVIGDSINTDIKGGVLAGIDTCWLNPKNIDNVTEFKSTYTIANLEELYNIL